MRQEKQLLLDEITEQIQQAESFVIMSYVGLKAGAADDFRRSIAKMGGNVEMIRKRLLVRAAKESGINLDLATLPGHIGVVFVGKDPIETTKVVFKFSQEQNQALKVIGGRFDGQLYSGAHVEMLSKLPALPEMRAQFLGLLEAPMAQTLGVMDAILSSVVYCLDNKCQQEGEK